MATSASEKFRLSVPIGSIIPVIVDSPIGGSTYSIPSAGTVKGPWKASDNCAIPAGHKLCGTLDLTGGVYLRGSTTTGGSLGGNNTRCIYLCRHCPSTFPYPCGGFQEPHCHTFSLDSHTVDHDHTSDYFAKAYLGASYMYHACVAATAYSYTYRSCATGYSRSGSTGNSESGSMVCGTSASCSISIGHSASVCYWGVFAGDTSTANYMGPVPDHTSPSWNASGNNEPSYITARYLIKVN